MAAPVIVVCTKDTWVKVATGVTSAIIHKKILGPTYFQSYVLTTDPAPTDLTTGIEMLEQSVQFTLSAAADIYIYAANKAGSVRVDI